MEEVTEQVQDVCVCKGETPVFYSMAESARPKRTMAPGELFYIGKAFQQGGVQRVLITTMDGTREYLPCGGKIFRIRGGKLKTPKTVMYAAPNSDADPIETLRNGSQVVLVDTVTAPDGKRFLEIRDELGQAGYIDAETEVGPFKFVSNTAVRDMVMGGCVCAFGLLITIMTVRAAASSPHGGRFIIAYGPAIFGAIQFFRGLSNVGGDSSELPLRDRLMPQIIQEKAVQKKIAA